MLAWGGSKYPHLQLTLQGLATSFGCVVSIILILCLSTLWFTWTNHPCKQSVWWDANQSLRQRAINRTFRTRKPNNVACFILFMMVVEHWQLQEHVNWHNKSINMPVWIINLPEILWHTSQGDLATSPFSALPENHALNKYEECFKQIKQGASG